MEYRNIFELFKIRERNGNNYAYLLDWKDGNTLKSFETETDKSSGITVDDEGNIFVAENEKEAITLARKKNKNKMVK